MAVRSPHRAFLVAMILVSFLLGAAAGIRSTTLSSSQVLQLSPALVSGVRTLGRLHSFYSRLKRIALAVCRA